MLKAVGQALRRSARPYDAVGRFGGDGFVVVLPEAGAVAGRAMPGRYRAAVLAAIADSTTVPVSASVEVAELDDTGSATELLGAAYRTLTQAKAFGVGAVAPRKPETRDDGLVELTREVMRQRRKAPAPDHDDPRPVGVRLGLPAEDSRPHGGQGVQDGRPRDLGVLDPPEDERGHPHADQLGDRLAAGGEGFGVTARASRGRRPGPRGLGRGPGPERGHLGAGPGVTKQHLPGVGMRCST